MGAGPAKSPDPSWLLLRAHVWICAVVALGGLGARSVGYAPELWLRPMQLLVMAAPVWCLTSFVILRRTMLLPYVLFVLSYTAFHAGDVMVQLLGWSAEPPLDGRFSARIYVESLYLILLGALGLHAGALLAVRRAAVEPPPAEWRPDGIEVELRRVGLLLLLAAAPPTLQGLREALEVVAGHGYAAMWQQRILNPTTGLDAAGSRLASFLNPGLMFVIAGSRDVVWLRRAAVGLLLANALANLSLGSRGEVIQPALAVLFLWSHLIRRVRLLPVAVALAALFFGLFPAVKAVRNLAGSERSSTAALAQTVAGRVEHPAALILEELGNTQSTVAYTIELVPAHDDYEYGAGYAWIALMALPNFFWDVHPSAERVLYGNWLVERAEPFKRLIGGGNGFSVLAEAYLQGGWWFAPLLMAAVGFFLVRLSDWAVLSRHPGRLAVVASFVCWMVMWPRGSTANLIRPFLWYSLAPYLLACYLHALGLRQRARNPSSEA